MKRTFLVQQSRKKDNIIYKHIVLEHSTALSNQALLVYFAQRNAA